MKGFIPVLIAVVTGFFARGIQAAELDAAILACELPGHSPALIDALSRQLESDYRVNRIALDLLLKPDGLNANAPDLLVLPNASVIPATAVPAIEKYLRGGGDLIALRTPLSLKPPVLIDGKWIDKQEYLTAQAAVPPPRVLYDFNRGFTGWDRVTNHMEWPTTAEPVANQPAAGLNAVHVRISDLQGWDTFQAPAGQPFFAPGHTLTVFAARGTAKTNSLCLEFEEKDGSRWIATVPLSTEWKRIVITPEEFRYWMSIPGRGGAGDRFNPANSKVLKIGLAFSHTGTVRGPHEFWIGPFGTAARTSEFDQLIGDSALPALDTLCPSYKMFQCHDVAKISLYDQAPADGRVFAPPLPHGQTVRSPHPRPSGAGFDKGRNWRWIPLLTAWTASGEHRGTPATVLVHAGGPYKGGQWASFGVDDDAWYLSQDVLKMIGRVGRSMASGVHILDGGTDKYTYFEGQPIRAGVKVVNVSGRARSTRAHLEIRKKSDGARSLDKTWTLSIEPGQIASVSEDLLPDTFSEPGYLCSVQLRQEETPLDVVGHEVHIFKPKPLAQREYMTVKDGNFMLGGKRWRAHGINYMPSSGIGTEDNAYFEDWTGPRSYDPEIIQRDLETIKRIGYNSVSVFTDHRLIQWQNIVDLLRRCENLGLMVNLSLRPGTPMHFPWPKIKEMIESLRLAESDALFAYDLAWEPHFGRQADRVVWDRQWESWIVERYGSIENAEKNWEFQAPRDASGKLTNPPQSQVLTDGPWRRMVAAYRRFLDTLLYKKYGEARRLVRSIDPHHFVSFRMTEAGDPTFNWEPMLPYDFPYLVNAVDFLAPEAYGRIGDWEQVKPGWFELEYGRWADPAKPFIWAEQGVSTWAPSISANSPDLLQRQANFYREFYRMMIASGADGIYSWWYPGGFRWNENSDYGIINPDGSDRPVTRVIREMARLFLDGPDPKPIDTWIEFDRDLDARGIVGSYEKAKDEFWKAIDAGRTPGLRTAGTGTDSRNCPMLAVGNTPANGGNPPKYLDAAFDGVEVRTADGRWLAIQTGDEITRAVLPEDSLHLRVTVTNLGEAAWVADRGSSAAPESLGAVYLDANVADHPMLVPLPGDVPARGTLDGMPIHLPLPAGAGESRVTLRFQVAGRGEFGERFHFSVRPVQD